MLGHQVNHSGNMTLGHFDVFSEQEWLSSSWPASSPFLEFILTTGPPLLDCSVVLAHVKHDDWWHPESRACCTGGPPGLHVYLMLLVMPIDFLKRLTEWKKNSSITTQSTPDLLSNWPKLTIIVNVILFTFKDFINENTVIWNYKDYPIKSLSLKNRIRFIFVESAFDSNFEFCLINLLFLLNKNCSLGQVWKINVPLQVCKI